MLTLTLKSKNNYTEPQVALSCHPIHSVTEVELLVVVLIFPLFYFIFLNTQVNAYFYVCFHFVYCGYFLLCWAVANKTNNMGQRLVALFSLVKIHSYA